MWYADLCYLYALWLSSSSTWRSLTCSLSCSLRSVSRSTWVLASWREACSTASWSSRLCWVRRVSSLADFTSSSFSSRAWHKTNQTQVYLKNWLQNWLNFVSFNLAALKVNCLYHCHKSQREDILFLILRCSLAHISTIYILSLVWPPKSFCSLLHFLKRPYNVCVCVYKYMYVYTKCVCVCVCA